MAGSRAENRTRSRLLDELAQELTRETSPARRVRARRRRTLRLTPYLSLRTGQRRRLRVYCASDAGRYAFLTGDGRVIPLDDGLRAAVAMIAGRRPVQGGHAGERAAATHQGP